MATSEKWLGTKKCNVCGAEESSFWYDAKTTSFGRWAFMCQECWEDLRFYRDLGPGKGQKYDGITFEKVEG